MIKQTNEGFWVIKEDTHFTKWVEEAKRLDHDSYALNIILPNLGNGAIIDIGANIGTHTYAYSKKINSSKIIAIEPNEECCECLRKNIPDCHILNIAISDQESYGRYIRDENNIGASYFINGSDFKMYSLDSLIEKLENLVDNQPFTFIKMDIEGYECKALKGAKKFIDKYRPKMWLEVNVHALVRAGNSENELFDILKNYNYNVYSYPSPNVQYDILCLPQ